LGKAAVARGPLRTGTGVKFLEVVEGYSGLDEEGEFHDDDWAEYGDPAGWKYPGDNDGNTID
jgi:hypothetical protein